MRWQCGAPPDTAASFQTGGEPHTSATLAQLTVLFAALLQQPQLSSPWTDAPRQSRSCSNRSSAVEQAPRSLLACCWHGSYFSRAFSICRAPRTAAGTTGADVQRGALGGSASTACVPDVRNLCGAAVNRHVSCFLRFSRPYAPGPPPPPPPPRGGKKTRAKKSRPNHSRRKTQRRPTEQNGRRLRTFNITSAPQSGTERSAKPCRARPGEISPSIIRAVQVTPHARPRRTAGHGAPIKPVLGNIDEGRPRPSVCSAPTRDERRTPRLSVWRRSARHRCSPAGDIEPFPSRRPAHETNRPR